MNDASEIRMTFHKPDAQEHFIAGGDASTLTLEISVKKPNVEVPVKAKRHVLLFENEWSMRWAEEKNKGLRLEDIAG